jgi:N-acetylglucosamine repressor
MCGNRGCWETQVSLKVLFQHIWKCIEQGQNSSLSGMTHGKKAALTLPLIVEAARTGDEVALDGLKVIGRHLGVGIASLMNALNPELVVCGGRIPGLAGDILLPIIENEVVQRALKWNRDASQIVLARHGFDACVMGGVAKVYQTILAQPDILGSRAS